jgi:hypothetical protein
MAQQIAWKVTKCDVHVEDLHHFHHSMAMAYGSSTCDRKGSSRAKVTLVGIEGIEGIDLAGKGHVT